MACVDEFWKECDLEVERVVALSAGLVDRGLPGFALIPSVQFEVGAQALDYFHAELILGDAAGDEVSCGLLVQILELHPLVPAEVVREPSLAAFAFAAD